MHICTCMLQNLKIHLLKARNLDTNMYTYAYTYIHTYIEAYMSNHMSCVLSCHLGWRTLLKCNETNHACLCAVGLQGKSFDSIRDIPVCMYVCMYVCVSIRPIICPC